MSCKIYKITCETGAVYYGSTIRTLKIRLQSHIKEKSTTCKDFINPKIELVKEVDENNRYEEEAYYIKNFDCVNKNIPTKRNPNPIYKIYKITCETGKIYYGHTIQKLKDRLHGHKHSKNCSSKDFINPKIELLEICKKEEVKEKEGYYIRNFDCVNINLPNKTKEERKKDSVFFSRKWYANNKEKETERRAKRLKENLEEVKEYRRQHYIKNRDKKIKQNKLWKENNQERDTFIKKRHYENNKEKYSLKNKLWTENNKEKVIGYKKKYYLENKKRISQKNKIKITCDCGSIITQGELSRHKRSKKHLDLMENITS